jgi:hypothetical protein
MRETAVAGARLPVWFKGGRTYVHGTDLFNALAELSGVARDPGGAAVRLSLHHPITRGVAAVPLPAPTTPDGAPAALFELARDGDRRLWAVYETDEPVRERRPYDEDAVAAGARSTVDEIAQRQPTPYTFIERVVALNKRLLEHGAAADGGWWFTRLELTAWPAATAALRLRRAGDLGGRLVKSSIDADDVRVGAVYFTRKQP